MEYGWISLLSESGKVGAWVYWVVLVFVALIAYLLGSLNFAVIFSRRFFRDDVRSHGSGNAGMTNMLRTYGKGAAAMTLLFDALKAAVSILLIGAPLCGSLGAYTAGLLCIIGHAFPIFYQFHGGKGVVTSAVMILCLSPLSFVILLGIFLLLACTTRYISLASIMSMMIFPFVLSRVEGNGPHILFALIIAAFVIWLHRSNIKRLLSGTENKISFGKKKEPSKKK